MMSWFFDVGCVIRFEDSVSIRNSVVVMFCFKVWCGMIW